MTDYVHLARIATSAILSTALSLQDRLKCHCQRFGHRARRCAAAVSRVRTKDTANRVIACGLCDIKKSSAMDLTQEEFARLFGIGLWTLRHWEQGDRKLKGTKLVLLTLIANEPKTVLRLLAK